MGVGRTLARTRVLLIVRNLHIRIINAATGELLRELTLDPDRNYHPQAGHPDPRERWEIESAPPYLFRPRYCGPARPLGWVIAARLAVRTPGRTRTCDRLLRRKPGLKIDSK